MTTTTLELAINGMHCNSCGLLVDETLEELDGVVRSSTTVRIGRARIEFDPEVVGLERISEAIDGLGYATAAAEGRG